MRGFTPLRSHRGLADGGGGVGGSSAAAAASWPDRMKAFVGSLQSSLDLPFYSHFNDPRVAGQGQDWRAGAGTVANPNPMIAGGGQVLGTVTGYTHIRPEMGNAVFVTPNTRLTPFAVCTRAAIRAKGATVTHAPCTLSSGGNCPNFGLKGSISNNFYSLWVEDGAGAVIAGYPSQITVKPVLLQQSPTEDFVLWFDGVTLRAYYTTDSDDGNLVLVASSPDISDLSLTTGSFYGAATRTSAGGTEQMYAEQCLVMLPTAR